MKTHTKLLGTAIVSLLAGFTAGKMNSHVESVTYHQGMWSASEEAMPNVEYGLPRDNGNFERNVTRPDVVRLHRPYGTDEILVSNLTDPTIEDRINGSSDRVYQKIDDSFRSDRSFLPDHLRLNLVKNVEKETGL